MAVLVIERRARMRRYPALNFLSPGLGCVLLTVQGEHGRDPLTVGDSSGIGDAVLPQVGEVVGGGQHDAVHLGPGPDLSGHGGADQDPAGHADHEAADLHVHHHRPVAHGGGGKKDRAKNPSSGAAANSSLPPGGLQGDRNSEQKHAGLRGRQDGVCVHHHLFCLEGGFGSVKVNVFVAPAWF